MSKTTLSLLLLVFSVCGFSQCINTTKFPLSDLTADNGGLEIQINSCTETDEYTVLTGLTIGEDYEFTITDNFTSEAEYITITDTSNNVIVHNTSPINWTATMGSIRIHWTEDASCGTQASCHRTTYRNTTNTASAPANDDPSGAISLSVGNTSCEATVLATNISATASEVADSSIPAPSCSNYAGGDVWFKVIVPNTGEITVETTSESGSAFLDSGMAIYSGPIGAFTQVACDDDASSDGLFSLVALTGRTPGEELHIRVFEFQNNAFGEFNICAWSPTTLSNESRALNTFAAYPNPVTDNYLQINGTSVIQEVAVFDILGGKVMEVSPNALDHTLDLAGLSKGAYLVSVVSEREKQTFKVIKE